MDPLKFGGLLLANLLVCIGLGVLLDHWTGWTPFWVIALCLYAIIGSFALLLFKRRDKDG